MRARACALLILLAAGSAGCGGTAPDAEPALELDATGFFHTQQGRGRWWLVTPDGKPFFSLGVNHVTANPDTDRVTGQCPYCDSVAKNYATNQDWADATLNRLDGWGFNTVGAWSDVDLFSAKMPYTVLLDLGSGVSDWFAPEFEASSASTAAKSVAPRKDDPNLLGWFLDNELHWGRDWRDADTLLETYQKLPAGSPGRVAADAHAGDASGFVHALAERYFEVTTGAVRAADPNHMILGVRIISVLAPAEVVSVAGEWVDVMSVNDYEYNAGLPDLLQKLFGPVLSTDDWLSDFYATARRPLLLSEFSYRATDSGLPNSYPPVFPVLETQSDRADAYEKYAKSSYAASYVVGQHWFELVDEPKGGRFDGENSNFGLLSTEDVPWQTLVDRMTEVHARSPHLRVPTK